MILLTTLKRSSKWPLFNFIFSDLALILLKWIFDQLCAFQWTKFKWCFERVFYHFTIFGSKMLNSNFLKKIRVLSAFFRIEVQVISNPSSQLEKKKQQHQTSEFLLKNDFFFLFKKKTSHFLHFSIFSKIINCTYLYNYNTA